MRKKVYAAWILAIIMVMSGVLCTQAETVSTGKAHGSKVNTTGETTPTEAEKQFEEAEQIYVTVRYSSDWEYSEYSYSSDYGSYVELSIPDDGIYVRINASINTPLDYASELYDFGINAYDVIVEDPAKLFQSEEWNLFREKMIITKHFLDTIKNLLCMQRLWYMEILRILV